MAIDTFIGIDPGASGGIAWIKPSGSGAEKMPETDDDIWDMLVGAIGARGVRGRVRVLLEKVGPARRRDPETGKSFTQGVASTFKFGQNYGLLRGMLTAADGVSWDLVVPKKWQAEFSLVIPKSRGLTPTQKKNEHKAAAQRLFPDIKVTHARADALLIAEYLRRRELATG